MSKNIPVLDPSQLDTKYTSFPAFSLWSELVVDNGRWEAQRSMLQERGASDHALVARARDVAKRAAAIDTGAIEGLYDLDAGFTISVASQIGMWQAAFEKKEQRARELIEAQLAAYDEVIDLATGSAPFAEAWIRGLHEKLCSAQPTYIVHTPQGDQEQELPLGQYKMHPNHVRKPDGSYHVYAPVIETPAEMQRLLSELTSNAFQQAHPVLQATYSHYVLTCIHPFADGNGRVARALASVYLYRAASIPLMVLVEHRSPYLDAIRAADRSEPQRFVSFVYDRCIDAFQLVAESLRTAKNPSSLDAAAAARKLHVTRGGYTHAQVDEAGWSLILALEEKAREVASNLTDDEQLTVLVHRLNQQYPTPPKGYRNPVSRVHELLQIHLDSHSPASAQAQVRFAYHVPIDAAPEDEVIITCLFDSLELRVPMADIIPKRSTVLLLRLAMYFEGRLAGALATLTSQAKKALRDRGYIP